MMRHHFQSQYFWHYHNNAAETENKQKTLDDSGMSTVDIGKSGQSKKTTLMNHQKVDCAFIFLAIFIVSGFTLTISSYGTKKLNFVDQVFDTPINEFSEDEMNVLDIKKILSNMVPLSYVLYVYPRIDKRTYSSVVKIGFKCKEPLSHIVFHSSFPNIHSIILRSKDGEIHVSKFKNLQREITILLPEKSLQPGVSYELLITSYGILTFNQTHPLHLVKYNDANGQSREMMMTNIGNTGPRGAWPCVDDPSLKATWKVIVQHEKKYKAISNMPVSNVKVVEPNMVETYFEVSPKMSGDLVSLILTELNHKEMSLPNGLKIRTFAPPSLLKFTALPLKVAYLVVDYYANKFKSVNPLKKLDIVPIDSQTLPAESWGVIVLEKDFLLDDSSTNSLILMERLALAISRQVCNQWFGNVVTPKKSLESWLQEAICGYVQILPLQHYYPSWQLSNWFYTDMWEPAITYDSNKFSQSVDVAAKDALANKALKYYKPSSLIAMLADFIGHDAFLKGLNMFLKENQFDSADTDAFWKVMSEVSSIKVGDLMNRWINQPGYPLLTTKRVSSGVLIEQKRFAFLSNAENQGNDESQWHIPVFVKICGRSSEYILKTNKGIVPVDSTCSNDVHYLINFGAKGFYQVAYSMSNWLKLLDLLNTDHNNLSAIDRANLLENLHSLARYDHVNITLLLDFTRYLKDEHDFLPWKMASEFLDELYNLFYDTKVSSCVKEYTSKLITPVMEYMNSFTNHSHPQKRLISLLLNYAVSYLKRQFRPIQVKMENEFFRWEVSDGKKKLGGSIKGAVLTSGIFNGGSNEWNFVMHQFQNATSSERKSFLLNILASSKSTYQLRTLVNYGKDNLPVLTQVCKNNIGKEIAWGTVKKNWRAFLKSYRASDLEPLLAACLGSGKTSNDLTKAMDIKASLPDDSELTPLMNRIIEDIKININYRKKEETILQWFHTNGIRCSD